jgi:hypothetical protein
MNKLRLRILSIISFVALLAASSTAGHEINIDKDAGFIEKIIQARVKLLNEIIKDPKAANMKNWKCLANQNDESELMFFMNSISDGTETNTDYNSTIGKRLIAHSRSDFDQSILLQYLRLSIMAFNSRPRSTPAYIKINNIFRNNEAKKYNQFVAKGFLFANDATGHPVQYAVQMKFGIDIVDSTCKESKNYCSCEIYLEDIVINGHEIYGWWYDLIPKKE